MFRVELWAEGSDYFEVMELVERASTEREARAAAARLLGRPTLRGANVHRRGGQGGTVFRFFGPQDKENGWPSVVIITEAAALAGERVKP